MGATAETIWRVPAYLPFLQPPLTEEAVTSAEAKLGYKLPAEYLDLLRKQNGGYIRVSLPESVHVSIAGIGPCFPSLHRLDRERYQQDVSFPLQGLISFDGDGHWHLCLDYRRDSRNPSVTHADIEGDYEFRIADSFAAYLDLLELDVDDKYVLEDVADLDEVKSRLSSSLPMTFDPPDSSAHGYPTHRAGLGTQDNPGWLWISPNLVPRGFVRENDPRYDELKHLMAGDVPRFPELPAGSYLLSATDKVRSRVIEACARSRLIVRPLREYLKSM